MKSKILLVALLFGACSCSQKGDGTVSFVDVGGSNMAVMLLDELKSNVAKIPLSSLVENCELVQLETSDNAFFKPWFTTITDKYIGVCDQEIGSFKLFSRSGKFLCNVGSIGQGPGDYAVAPYDAIIDDRNELIYLSPFAGSNNILVYNTSGHFLKNIAAPFRLNKSKIFLSDSILSVVHMPFQNTRAMSLQFNINTGAVIKEVAPLKHLIMNNYNSDIINTRNAPGIFDFSFMSCDTLYYFDLKNNMIRPTFKITYNSSDKLQVVHFQINKNLIFSNVLMLEADPNGWQKYFPKGLVATDLKNKTSSYISIVNDYFGNIPVEIDYFTAFHGYYILNIQPEDLMENIENRLTEKDCTDSDRQTLKKTLVQLKENTNNVVFIGKLKSNINSKLW